MRKYLTIFMSMALLLIVAACGNADDGNGAGDGTDKSTITLGQPPYEHVWFANGIIQQVAEELGYPVEITEGDTGVAYLGLSTGEIDIFPDAWAPSLHSNYIEQYEGSIELVGALYEDLPIGWAVPTYVDIDSIEDLIGREDEFQSRIVGYEPGAGQMITSEELIEGYGLDYELLGGSVPAMLTEVTRATNNEEPIVFLAWRPHPMFQMFDIKILEDPKGYFQLDDVKNGVSTNLKEKAPDVYQFLENLKIDVDDVESALVRMDEEGATAEQLATEWIEANREQVDQWLGK